MFLRGTRSLGTKLRIFFKNYRKLKYTEKHEYMQIRKLNTVKNDSTSSTKFSIISNETFITLVQTDKLLQNFITKI